MLLVMTACTSSTLSDPIVVALEQSTLSATERAQYERDSHGQWRRYTLGLDGQPFWERYCRTCHIWRAPRVSHCPQCNYCMVG